MGKSLLILHTSTRRPRGPPVPNGSVHQDHVEPIPKYMCINQEETKASDQVEHVSLQESIVWKVCLDGRRE